MKVLADDKKRLFRGDEINLQNLEQSNVVRVFISSTFSDMSMERNTLLEKAYPALRTYCQQIGLDFQVMDMRWGIQETATVDHSTCELCLMEIRTCKRLSVGPHFVAFIGNRYGYRPIPSNIDVNVFEKILAITKENNGDDDLSLLHQWYRRDDNTVPPVYVLQPITSHYSFFDDQDPANEKKRIRDRGAWEKTTAKLTELLRNSAKVALGRGEITEDQGKMFFKSVTELEIEEGLSMEGLQSAYLYRREITDLEQHLAEKQARLYVDLNAAGRVDEDAQNLLKKLKTGLEKSSKLSSNVKNYAVEWMPEQGISTASKSHSEYLERFCHDFVNDLKRAIKDSTNKLQSAPTNPGDSPQNGAADPHEWVLEEVLHQASFAKTKCESFCGRKQLLDSILSPLHSATNRHPVVVFGESGRGKTALAAMAVKLCRKVAPSDVLVYRFLGTSPNSSHIHDVLQSLILQICEAFDLTVPGKHLLQNFNGVVQRFSKLMEEVSNILSESSDSNRLIIFLDSLDQLSSQNGAHRMNWLPKQLPINVQVLLTTLPDPALGILKSLQRTLPGDQFIEVTVLEDETGREILDTWLAADGRALSRDQTELVMKAFNSDPKPLFLKLAFDEARRWNSYTDMTKVKFADSARGAISYLFDHLEANHGHMFVSKAFGYLVAAKNGIAEGELDDLLSLDDHVLNSSYRYWSPSNRNVVRVPPLLWTRLRYDLGGDLVERQAVGHTVLAFYHRQYIEVARERYLTESCKAGIHGQMADYYMGKWSDGRRKELVLKIWKNRKNKVDRQVASQPLKFSDRVFNTRKLDELPYHLVRAGKWTELYEEVLCNITWMLTKIAAFAIKDVLDDYNMALEAKSDPGISLIRDALKLAKPTLEFSGGITNHLCVEMYGRLAYFADEFPGTVGRFLQGAKGDMYTGPGVNLVPLTGGFQPPGGALRTTLTGFSKHVTCLATSGPGTQPPLVAAGCQDGLVMVWEIGSDEVMHTVRTHKASVACLAIAGLRLASGSHDNTLHVMNLDTGSSVTTIQEDHRGYDVFAGAALSSDGGWLASSCGNEVKLWDLTTAQCLSTLVHREDATISCDAHFSQDNKALLVGYSDGNLVCWKVKEGSKSYEVAQNESDQINSATKNKILSCGVFEESVLVCSANGNLALRALDNGAVIANVKLGYSPSSVAYSSSGKMVAVGHDKTFSVLKIDENQFKTVGAGIRHHRDVITSLAFNQSEALLVVGSADEEMTAWELQDEAGRSGDKRAGGNRERTGSGGLMRIGKSPVCEMKGMGAPIDLLLVAGDVVVSASTKVFYLKLWNLRQQNIVTLPTTFPFNVINNDVSSCGKYLAYADNLEGCVKIHDLDSKNFSKFVSIPASDWQRGGSDQQDKSDSQKSRSDLEESAAVELLQFSHTSNHVFFTTSNGLLCKIENPMRMRKAANLTQRHPLTGGNGYVTSLSISHDDQYLLAVVSEESDDRLLLLATAGLSVELDLVTSQLGVVGHVTASCMSDSRLGDLQLFLGGGDRAVHVIDLRQKASNSSSDELQLWEASPSSKLEGHSSLLTCLALNVAQDTLFTGSSGDTRRLWRKQNQNWELLHEIKFHSLLHAGVTCCSFTCDGRYVITGSHERSVKVWSVDSGKLIAAQYVYATVTGITVTDDQRVIITNKMGFVIVDKLIDEKNPAAPEKIRSPGAPEKRKTSSHKKRPKSSVCQIA